MIKISKIIRIVTVVPIMAFIALTILLFSQPEVYQGYFHYFMAILFLVVLPISAYPIHAAIPILKKTGRDGQRNFAIFMAIVGYLSSILFCIFTQVPGSIFLIYLAYLFSGIGILVFNRILKIKASGHSCGVFGPILILIYFLGPKALWGLVVLALAIIASLITKRHTLPQLLWGCFIPVCAFLISLLVKFIFY